MKTAFLLSVIVFFVVIVGCQPDEISSNVISSQDTSSYVQLSMPDAKPMSETAICEDLFKVTFSTSRTQYNTQLNPEKPFEDYVLEIEYIGEEEKEFFHASSMELIMMKRPDGEKVFNYVVNHEGFKTTFKKGDTYTSCWDGREENRMEGPFEAGEYSVEAWFCVDLDQTDKEFIQCYVELPLIIK